MLACRDANIAPMSGVGAVGVGIGGGGTTVEGPVGGTVLSAPNISGPGSGSTCLAVDLNPVRSGPVDSLLGRPRPLVTLGALPLPLVPRVLSILVGRQEGNKEGVSLSTKILRITITIKVQGTSRLPLGCDPYALGAMLSGKN